MDKKLPLKRPPKKQRKLKKIFKEARAIAKGTILGQYDAHAKKPLLESLKEHLGKTLDNIDPLETVAIISGTWLIHGVIINAPSLASKAFSLGTQYFPMAGPAVNPFTFLFQSIFGFLAPAPKEPEDSLAIWMIAFFLAFMLVRYGGELLGLGQNMSVLVGMLLV